AFADLLEGLLETFRRGDAAVVATFAAFEIADAIERLQHLFTQLGSLAQNRLADIGGGIGKAGKIVVAVDLEHVVEQKAHIFHGGFVDRHGVLPAGGQAGVKLAKTFLARFSVAGIAGAFRDDLNRFSRSDAAPIEAALATL